MKLISLILLSTTLALSSCEPTKTQETFEGTITYKTTVKTKTDDVNYNDYQKQKYGDQMKLTIAKDGSFKREFLNNGQNGFVYLIYKASSNMCFSKWRNFDSAFSMNCAENSLKLISEKELPSETINDQACKAYFISGIDTLGGQTVSMTYYYPIEKEYINPTLYKNYKDFFYNKVMEKTKAPFYKLLMDMGKYTVTFEVVKIESGPIDQTIFNLPTNTPIKEM